MHARTLLRLTALAAALTLPYSALAAEDEPEAEAPPAAPPPTTAPPAAQPAPAPAPAPGQRSAPVMAPGAYPAPIWGAPAPAPAPAPAEADKPAEPEPEEEPEGIVIPRWQIATGVRTTFISDAGYDPFSENNALVQFSIGGGRSFHSQGMFSVAATGFYDFANVSSTARGEPTELEVHRLSLGPELRAHLLPVLYAFARPSAAVLRTSARLEESTTQSTLYARAWTVGFDATVGAAFRAFSTGRSESSARFWLIGEGGYGWSSASDLRLGPEDDDSSAPQRVADVDLGSLALRGPMFRVLIAATF